MSNNVKKYMISPAVIAAVLYLVISFIMLDFTWISQPARDNGYGELRLVYVVVALIAWGAYNSDRRELDHIAGLD